MPKPPERGKQAATSKKDDKGKKVDTTSKKHHRSSNSPPQDSSSSKRRPQGRAAESQRHRATRDQEDPGMPSRHNDGSGVETYPNTDFQGPGSGYGPQSFQPPPPSHRPPQQQQQYVQLLQQQLWAPPQQQQQYVPDPLPEQYPQQQQDLEVDFSDLLEQQLWDPELKQPPQQQQQYAQDPQPERYQQSYPHLPPQSVAGQSGHHPSLTDQVHGQTHGYWQPPTLGTPAQPQAFGYGTGQTHMDEEVSGGGDE
ncbi:hypothetical protein GE09DRAFT_1220846 [Coniochaeta sp. 2T2.1]|nr:hypothetical protein GE09DRAFT_1220846 [Coniochaeta sp. 2T2.1]